MKSLGQLIATNQDKGLICGAKDLANTTAPQIGFDTRQVRVARLTIATIVLDTSSSIREIHDEESGRTYDGQSTIIEFYNRVVDDIDSRSSPRHQAALGCIGFNGIIHPWELSGNAPLLTCNTYVPNGGTPLYDTVSEAFKLAQKKRELVLEKSIPCNLTFMIVCDAADSEHSRHSNARDIRKQIGELMSQPGNLVYGVGIGSGATDRLKDMGIPSNWVKNATSRMNLADMFREFSTMSTQGAVFNRRNNG